MSHPDSDKDVPDAESQPPAASVDQPAQQSDSTGGKGCLWFAVAVSALLLLLVGGCLASSNDSSSSSSTPTPPRAASTSAANSQLTDIPCTQWLVADADKKVIAADALLNGARKQRGITTPAAYALSGEFAVEIEDGCQDDPSEKAIVVAANVLLDDVDHWMS